MKCRAGYGEIIRPVLILWGEEDRWIPHEKSDELHAMIPGSRLQKIPSAAHLAMEDASDVVTAALQQFVLADQTG